MCGTSVSLAHMGEITSKKLVMPHLLVFLKPWREIVIVAHENLKLALYKFGSPPIAPSKSLTSAKPLALRMDGLICQPAIIVDVRTVPATSLATKEVEL